MKISLPVDNKNILDKKYGGYAPKEVLINGDPKLSFPINWSNFDNDSKYIHIILIDYDSNPVCGFTYFHWGLTNLEISKYQNGIPENLSIERVNELNQAVHSGYTFDRNELNKSNYICYYGPFPPNCPHTYTMYVMTTKEPLNINNGWLINEFVRELENHKIIEWKKINFIYNNF